MMLFTDPSLEVQKVHGAYALATRKITTCAPSNPVLGGVELLMRQRWGSCGFHVS